MDDRIGALHLHYRIRGGGSLAPALIAGFDRAVQAGLGEALSRRMAALLGDGKEVVVVRELKASVALAKADCSLDSRVVECISRASAQAVLTMLSADPSTDTVMRFEDQAEFTGSFIVALIEGTAWERWYYGAFHRYRRADPAATLRAVLEESGAEVAAVFGWLSRRGHLAALLALLAPREARRLLGGGIQLTASQDRADGSAILVDAAKRLLALLEPSHGDPSVFDQRIAKFLAVRPIAPDWTSTSSLSVWVMQLLRFVLRLPDGAMPASAPREQDAIRALLAGALDWLDIRWLEAQLCGVASESQTMPAAARTQPRQLLTTRQERVLQQLARRLRKDGPNLADSGNEDEIVVRMIALAAAGAGDDGPLDRSIIAVIEQAVRAVLAAQASTPDAPTSTVSSHANGPHAGDTPPRPQATRAIKALRAAGPSAVALLNAMLSARGQDIEPGEASAAAGIFLLARAVSDTRLPALARQTGVPLAPLLAALAAKWSGATLPADHAMALWCGAEPADPAAPFSRDAEPADQTMARSFAAASPDLAELDAAGAALDELNEALVELLADRRMLDGVTAHELIAADVAALDHALQCAPHTASRVAATASILLRGWAHWLPGVAGSSPLFLLERSVRRAGCVSLADQRILVELDPAPLDIVLRMAGYLAPIEHVDWLGGRSVIFALRDHAGEPLS